MGVAKLFKSDALKCSASIPYSNEGIQNDLTKDKITSSLALETSL